MNGTREGGTITTYGSVIGNIVINGSMNGPTVSDRRQRQARSINVNGTLQGGISPLMDRSSATSRSMAR